MQDILCGLSVFRIMEKIEYRLDETHAWLDEEDVKIFPDGKETGEWNGTNCD